MHYHGVSLYDSGTVPQSPQNFLVGQSTGKRKALCCPLQTEMFEQCHNPAFITIWSMWCCFGQASADLGHFQGLLQPRLATRQLLAHLHFKKKHAQYESRQNLGKQRWLVVCGNPLFSWLGRLYLKSRMISHRSIRSRTHKMPSSDLSCIHPSMSLCH